MLKIIISCNGLELIETSEGSPCIHLTKNSETTIEWCSLTCNHALKSHSSVDIHNMYLPYFKLKAILLLGQFRFAVQYHSIFYYSKDTK